MLRKLKNRAWNIVYNDTYIAYIDNTTKVYARNNEKEVIISVSTRQGIWGGFISNNDLLVKSNCGIYYFINLSTLSVTKIKPKVNVTPNKEPIVDIESKVIYDFIDDDCISTLLRIKYDGTYKKLFTLPVYGSTKIYSKEDDKIIIINERGVNEVKDKSLSEVRRYEYDLKEEKVLDEKINVTPLRPLYFGDDFILYRNGAISDYSGNMLNKSYIPICFDESYPIDVFYVGKIDTTYMFISTHEELFLLNFDDEKFFKKLPISDVVNVIHYEDKLLFCTWDNVYSMKYNEIYGK